jgi:hypothetical protein
MGRDVLFSVLIAYLDRGSILKATSTCFVDRLGLEATILPHVLPRFVELGVLVRSIVQSHVLALEELAVLAHRADLDADAAW